MLADCNADRVRFVAARHHSSRLVSEGPLSADDRVVGDLLGVSQVADRVTDIPSHRRRRSIPLRPGQTGDQPLEGLLLGLQHVHLGMGAIEAADHQWGRPSGGVPPRWRWRQVRHSPIRAKCSLEMENP
jgi:hypothetical protein